MRYPDFLKENGTIGFPAPAFGAAMEPYTSQLEGTKKRLSGVGYRLITGENAYRSDGVGISSTPENCARELEEMYCGEESDALISCGGGELMCEILPFLDFERIRSAKPKWFEGYSDNTNFTYLLATACDTASIYGSCAGAFGKERLGESERDALRILTGGCAFPESAPVEGSAHTLNPEAVNSAFAGEPDAAKSSVLSVRSYDAYEIESLCDEEHPLAPLNATEPRIHKLFLGAESARQAGVSIAAPEEEIFARYGGFFLSDARTWDGTLEFSGRLIGGCMDCLVNLTGTEFDHTAEFLDRYESDGFVWFLEACDLNVYAIRRAMFQMEHAGWFRKVKGFLFGRPANGAEMFGLDAYEAVLPVAAKHHAPVVLDADIGHVPPRMPLITGSIADVLLSGNEMEIRMELR